MSLSVMATAGCNKEPSGGPRDPNNPGTSQGDPNQQPMVEPIVDAKITYSEGNFESEAVECEENNPEKATVEYKLQGASDYTAVDKQLIRKVDATTARVDVLGLKGGAVYDFKIKTSGNETLTASSIATRSYDRSGYAHFNYTQGVGAYNDDGTLKDNALVIYVTDENKDTVMDEVCTENPDVTMFKIPGDDWGNKNASGIGWWLNNNQYTSSNAGSKKNKVPSNTYDATNGGKLGFKTVDKPIAIRFIGKVTTPEGCTAYNDTKEGGGVGDNGHMARLKNLKNITLEGVGEDAELFGWGLHFVAGTDAKDGEGKSFEVRNLTFNEYPEDAVGMEGQQANGKITAAVERCWVHNNTFRPGHCENPAESDKKEGDGSCDFKRGMYFTCSYNYFEYCHKTNLIGSSDDSLQYNMTYHHNWWYQCGSRIPLTRQANVHFYNNYVLGDQNEKTTPYSWIAKPALSYVHSLRASCYLFSEANYYDGMKAVTEDKTGGAGKAWNNMYYACFGANLLVEATTREQKISNNCKYGDIDYSSFDSNPQQFYYDATNKKTDAFVTDAKTAREDCMKYSGVLKHSYENIKTAMTDEKPSAALSVPQSGLTIDLSKATLGGEVSGVKFVNGKNNSGNLKGKGLLAVFTVAEEVEISVNSSGSGDTGCELLNVDGTVVAGKFSSFSGTLKAGTYMIATGQKDKEGTITSLSFKSGMTDEERVANVINLINAIGTVQYTEECRIKIDMAKAAYDALSEANKANVTNAATLTEALSTYNAAAVAPVIELINAIGTVNEDSGAKIAAARKKYGELNKEQQAMVSNYSVLVAAENAYIAFEVKGVQKAIDNLAAPSSATTEQQIRDLLDEYTTVQLMYGELDDEQKPEITNSSKITDGIEALLEKLMPYDIKEDIADLPDKEDITLSHAAKVAEIRKGYDLLSAEGKTIVGDITKLTDAEEAIHTLASQSRVGIFQKNHADLAGSFTVSSGAGYKGTSQTFEYNGTAYDSPLKMESKTNVTFSTAEKMKLTIYLHGGGTQDIAVDGKTYKATNGIVEIEIEAGEHKITRGSGEAWLCYVILSPIV